MVPHDFINYYIYYKSSKTEYKVKKQIFKKAHSTDLINSWEIR